MPHPRDCHVIAVCLLLWSSRAGRGQGQSFSITTIKGDEYTFTSTNGEDIRDLVLHFLDGLKKRSKYVIAMMDYQSPGEGGGAPGVGVTGGQLINEWQWVRQRMAVHACGGVQQVLRTWFDQFCGCAVQVRGPPS